jgi:predicted DsbA family dithiol-disulfide isomerase
MSLFARPDPKGSWQEPDHQPDPKGSWQGHDPFGSGARREGARACLELRVYYDFASPFCYVSRAVVARLRARYDLAVHWLPFEVIDYLPPKGAMPQNPAFVRRGEAQRTARLAQEYGLTIHLRERLLNSNLALCAVEHVRATTGGDLAAVDRLHAAFFEAFYRDQRDIGDMAVVLDVAEAAGLAEGLDAALRTGRYRAVVAESRASAHAIGVVAVPTWLAGGYGVVGIPAFEEVERFVQQAIDSPRSA